MSREPTRTFTTKTLIAFGARAALAGLAAWTMLPGEAAAGIGCTPSASLTEVATGNGGSYGISTGELCGQALVAFAVDNNQSQQAYTFRSGWSSNVVDAATWDDFFQLAAFGPSGEVIYAVNTADLGAFHTLFGADATQANVYWWNVYFGNPIFSNQVVDADDGIFGWQFGEPASTPFFVVLDLDAPTPGPTPAAEPANLAAFSLGVAGLALMRRRRRSTGT